MLISPVKGCRRWSEGASAGSERVWAPQLRMRRQPTWLSSPPGVAIGRVPATSCAGACARCSAEEASCDAALARAQRVELAEQPAQTALASRCAGALSRRNTEGLPADVKSKLVLGLSCVAEGLHVAFLSEFDYAGEELRS